jgi:hypothetical protein
MFITVKILVTSQEKLVHFFKLLYFSKVINLMIFIKSITVYVKKMSCNFICEYNTLWDNFIT